MHVHVVTLVIQLAYFIIHGFFSFFLFEEFLEDGTKN